MAMKRLAGMSGPSPVPFEDLPVLPLCLEGPVSLDWLQKCRKEGREQFKFRQIEASRFITVSGGGRGDTGDPRPSHALAGHTSHVGGEVTVAQGATSGADRTDLQPQALTQAQRSTWKMDPSMPPQNM